MGLSIFKEQTSQEAAIPLYKEQILETFKNNFIKNSEHGKSIEHEELTRTTMTQLGFDYSIELDISFLTDWHNKIDQLSYLRNYLENTQINEVLVHNNCSVQIDSASGVSQSAISDLSPEDYQLSLENLANKNHQSWNYSNPFTSFFTSIEGMTYRATLIHFSAGPGQQSKLFLRKIRKQIFPIENFLYEQELKGIFLNNFIPNKKNIIVSGSTGSGKTSFLKTLISHISTKDHLIILEDTHEITPSSPFSTNLLSNDQLPGKSLKDYCAYSLRMRPDRIIIGEMRSNEVVPFILAMNTGHKGLMSTVHANSASDTLSRLALLFSLYSGQETLAYQTIMQLICKNIDYVVHLDNKRVTEIIHVLGSEENFPIFEQIYHA